MGHFPHGYLLRASTAICKSLCVPVQKRDAHIPLFQTIKPQHYKNEGALALSLFAVIASAITFDQGRAGEESPASDNPHINIYIYIRPGSGGSAAFSWRLMT